jgi:hypothetical protein
MEYDAEELFGDGEKDADGAASLPVAGVPA